MPSPGSCVSGWFDVQKGLTKTGSGVPREPWYTRQYSRSHRPVTGQNARRHRRPPRKGMFGVRCLTQAQAHLEIDVHAARQNTFRTRVHPRSESRRFRRATVLKQPANRSPHAFQRRSANTQFRSSRGKGAWPPSQSPSDASSQLVRRLSAPFVSEQIPMSSTRCRRISKRLRLREKDTILPTPRLSDRQPLSFWQVCHRGDSPTPGNVRLSCRAY